MHRHDIIIMRRPT